MKIIKTKINHEDERGIIRDMLIGKAVDALAWVSFKKGAVRGNHYHNHTVQYDYIVSGSILCRQQKKQGGEIDEAVLATGDVVTHEPQVRHAFKALEDSVMISSTCGPRRGEQFENDVVRLTGDERLIKD